MMIRVGQPPTNSAAHITTPPSTNWRAFPPRSIERELAVPLAPRASEPSTSADHGEERPVRAGGGHEELLALDVVEVQSTRSRPWQAEQSPYAAGGEIDSHWPATPATTATTIP